MLYPNLFCIGKFVNYISYSGVIILLHLNYICVFICMFVHNITVSALLFFYVIQYTCWFYFILDILSYIYPMYGLFHHCVIVTYAFAFMCL